MKTEKNLEWGSILNALNTTHDLTIRGMCKLLKTGRTWVKRHVIPQISENMIYLPSHRGGEGKGVNWATVAARQLGRGDIVEAKWFCRQDFYDLISRSVTSVTRQTIRLPVEMFVSDKEAYKSKYVSFADKIAEVNQDRNLSDIKKISKLNILYKTQEDLWVSCMSEDMSCIVEEGLCSVTARSKVEPTHCDYNVVAEMDKWVAPHDVLEYGDCDEQVYRKFFAYGFLRIEIKIKGEDGKTGEKVFYLSEQNPYRHQYVNQYLVFNYAVWLKYKDIILANNAS